jgi:membrane associated rhomboid family serine protease
VLPLRDENPTRYRPFATILLIVICAAVYFLVQPTPFASTSADARFEYRYAAIPTEVVHGHPLATCEVGTGILGATSSSIACKQPGGIVPYAPGKHTRLAVITSVFLHASIMHLLGNMLFLWIFGNNIEDRLRPIGYLLFFVVGGIVATIGHVVADGASRAPVVGASGSIAAVMGAYLVWYPKARVQTLVFFLPVRLPAFIVLLVWLVLQFFTARGSHVAWVAHVVGFVFGAVVAVLLGRRRSPQPSASNTLLI